MNMTSLNDVSRETLEALKLYEQLLKKWNPKINLVSKSTIEDCWERHFVDSAQVFEIAEAHEGLWLDIGSGGGFPGMVCAIISKFEGYGFDFSFIESDKRKCAFLNTVSRELDLNVSVKAERIENLPMEGCDILSSRALASLNMLLNFSKMHLSPNGTALFLKGENYKLELEEAQETWHFNHEVIQSKTNAQAVILKIRDIKNA